MHRYLIALGSNQRHVRHGRPPEIIGAALDALAAGGNEISAQSATVASRPIGPSSRQYANAVAIVDTGQEPLALLGELKRLEAAFGARRGQRWSRRVLDLDIILWQHGCFAGTPPDLVIPHPAFRSRGFVLGPARQIAAHWRDPVTGRTIAQLSWHRAQRENAPKKRAKLLDPATKRY